LLLNNNNKDIDNKIDELNNKIDILDKKILTIKNKSLDNKKKCLFCNSEFSNKQNLVRHINNYCIYKKNYDTKKKYINDDINLLLEDKKDLSDEIKKLDEKDDEIKKLLKK
jgi:hypothetical protein